MTGEMEAQLLKFGFVPAFRKSFDNLCFLKHLFRNCDWLSLLILELLLIFDFSLINFFCTHLILHLLYHLCLHLRGFLNSLNFLVHKSLFFSHLRIILSLICHLPDHTSDLNYLLLQILYLVCLLALLLIFKLLLLLTSLPLDFEASFGPWLSLRHSIPVLINHHPIFVKFNLRIYIRNITSMDIGFFEGAKSRSCP